MKRSIAFVITRMNWYRFLAPVIERALSNGWHVECWHDVGRFNPNRPEDFPDKDKALSYSSGSPVILEFQDVETIYKWIKERKVDAVCDIAPPTTKLREICKESRNHSVYICLNANADWHVYVDDPSLINAVDIFALNTPYWLDQSLEMMKSRSPIWWNDDLRNLVSAKTTFVGWPQLDQLQMISPDEIRKEYGIPVGKPIVVYFNWVDSHLFGLRQKMFSSTSLKDRLLSVFRKIDGFPAYLKFCFEPNLEQTMKAIRRFCDKNDAFLILKHRFRDKPFECECKAADLIISDESYFPHTIFKVLSVASLSLGYFSFAVRESIACKVPFLSIDACGLADLKSWKENGEPFYRQWSKPLGPFNYKGIVSVMKNSDLVRSFQDFSMSDFVFEERIYDEYKEKYLSDCKVPNSDFLLDTIESLIKSRN